MPRRRRPDDFDDFWFEPSLPLPAKDGIKAKNQGRGSFAQSWWARRWIAALERLGLGSRLQRGRSYARSGQVLSIDLRPGQVKARVQGSRVRPYNVSISIPPLDAGQWERAVAAMSAQAIFTVKLLAGEMPQDIEAAFQSAGVPLFPSAGRDLISACSCPDDANPCKHIAAVFYLLGERFDEQPFLIFELRGRSQEQIIDALRSLRAAASGDSGGEDHGDPAPPLQDSLDRFYATGAELNSLAVEPAAPVLEAAALRRLGPPPADIEADLLALYRAMTTHALKRLYGDDEP